MYAPESTTHKLPHYEDIRSVIGQYSRDDHTIVTLGDCNSVMSNELDVISGEHHKREVAGLKQLVTDLDSHDTWRTSHPENKEYTWSRNHPFTARRLDYTFVSQDPLNFTEQTDITTLLHSDHRAVTTTIVFHKYKKGPSYWKLNNSLLKEATYTECINQKIEHFKQHCHQNIDPHNKMGIMRNKNKGNFTILLQI